MGSVRLALFMMKIIIASAVIASNNKGKDMQKQKVQTVVQAHIE